MFAPWRPQQTTALSRNACHLAGHMPSILLRSLPGDPAAGDHSGLDAIITSKNFTLYPVELTTGKKIELTLRCAAVILQLPYVDLRDVDANHAHHFRNIDPG
jgi:hypothetical protein